MTSRQGQIFGHKSECQVIVGKYSEMELITIGKYTLILLAFICIANVMTGPESRFYSSDGTEVNMMHSMTISME